MDLVGRKIARTLVLCIFTLIWVNVPSTSASLGNITKKERQILDRWCPIVDICTQNATSADIKRNRKLDSRGTISCCGGCSCHPECKEQLNCCYRDDLVGDNDVNGNETNQQNTKRKCLPTYVGTPPADEVLPLYVTFVQPPQNGCVDSKPVRVKDTLLYPTCDDVDLTPWGPYYPVYSQSAGEVFQNVLCARCHGVTDAQMFTPELVCKSQDPATREATSLSQQVQVFTTGELSPNCYMAYSFEDPYEISNRRCFSETIDTCSTSNLDQNKIRDTFELTIEELKRFCEAGFDSPTFRGTRIYKNIFCYHCNSRYYSTIPKCSAGNLIKSKIDSFTHMINLELVLTHKKSIARETDHKMCLDSQDLSTDQEICRKINCPSGKVRNNDGDCICVSQRWGPGGIMMNIKLTPSDDQWLRTVQDSDHNELGQNVIASSPWSADWFTYEILRREDMIVCDEKAEFIVYMHLESSVKIPVQIYSYVQETIKKPWLFELNGQSMMFNQSFLEYEVNSVTVITQWQESILNTSNLEWKYLQCDKMRWKRIFKQPRSLPTIGRITQLLFCEQIQLEHTEYHLDSQNSLLVSNFTRRGLYKYQFEKIMDNEGYHVRVCAEDTIFVKKYSNEAMRLSAKIPLRLVILLAVYILENIY